MVRVAIGILTALIVSVVCGCGASQPTAAGTGTVSYPFVGDSTVGRQQPITAPNGSVVILPALPKTRQVEPSASCQRAWVSVPDGDGWTKKAVLVPPTPGLRAVAVDSHTARVTWWFHDVPDQCKPIVIRVSIVAGTDPRATPLTKEIEINGAGGSVDLTYPDFLKPPDVAIASTLFNGGLKSPDARVLISDQTS